MRQTQDVNDMTNRAVIQKKKQHTKQTR